MSGSTIIPWVVGNWKMNPMQADAATLVHQLIDLFASPDFDQQACRVAIAPTFIALGGVKAAVENASSPLHVVAQDVSRFAATGAYTGEISAELLQDNQIEYVLIGHSERRELLGDSPQILNAKLQNSLQAGMTVIYCVGESLQQREQGIAEQVVLQQVCDIAAVVTAEQWSKQILIAYEPIWAIGTGKTASAQDAQAMHASIRSGLRQLTQHADQIALLYGGSVKPDNAVELAACPDINGVLVGGASLNAQSFYQIAQAFA